MDFSDLINELRKGEPNINKAEKATKTLGWICMFGAAWNFIIPFITSSGDNPLLPESLQLAASISLSIIGVLFLISSRGIRQKAQWGVRTAQTAIILTLGLIIIFALFMVLIFYSKNSLPKEPLFRIFTGVIFALVFGQFFILGFFGVRYLGRLPMKKVNFSDIKYGTDNDTDYEFGQAKSAISLQAQTYKDALFPFGIGGTFVLLVAGLLVAVFAAKKYVGEPIESVIFVAGFVLIFFGPVVYNRLPSPFENNRKVITSRTGGGSAGLLYGSWPLFRLIIYEDGLEVRAMFHRFFIPYDQMEDVPQKVGFFSRGILIKSDLPDVPSIIRFMSFGIKKVNQTIIEAKTSADLFRAEHENLRK
jgi:hypothetical protein